MGIEKGGRKLLVSLIIFLILLIPEILMILEVSKAASDSNLSINQVESNLPDVTLYVRLDNVDMNSAKLKEKFSIKINDTPTQITDILSVKNDNGVTVNTAYLVLVDTSVSMQNQNQLSELEVLLVNLLDSGGPNDKTAVFGVSNKLETLKDSMVTDSSQITNSLRKAIASGSGTGTYLYSGIREAYDKGRTAKDLPARRIVVLITDGGVEGDCFSSDDIITYVDVDRLPVYTLILNNPSSIDEEFKNAADQIAEKTGSQSFISTSGNELFTQFKTSIEKGCVIKLRCDTFKAYNLQAVMNVAFKGNQGEIRQAAKFTAVPTPLDKEQLGQTAVYMQELRTSYYGVAVILIVMMLILIILLVLMRLLMSNKRGKDKSNGT